MPPTIEILAGTFEGARGLNPSQQVSELTEKLTTYVEKFWVEI